MRHTAPYSSPYGTFIICGKYSILSFLEGFGRMGIEIAFSVKRLAFSWISARPESSLLMGMKYTGKSSLVVKQREGGT